MAVHAVHRRRLRPLSLNGLRESGAQLVLCMPNAQQNSPILDTEDFTQSCCAFRALCCAFLALRCSFKDGNRMATDVTHEVTTRFCRPRPYHLATPPRFYKAQNIRTRRADVNVRLMSSEAVE